MADNRHTYGLRWYQSKSGAHTPHTIPVIVATGYQAQVGGATDVDLWPGDPVQKVSTGGIILCPGSEGTPGTIYGVVSHITQYFDGQVKRTGPKLPGATAYSTNLDRQSIVEIIPAVGNIFAIDVDENTTATTKAAYQAFIGENADHVLVADTSDANNPKSDVQLDISGHAVTQGLQWRIVGILEKVNTDFSGDNVTLLVEVNESEEPPGSILTTGV